jgi:hypothetical protein
MPLDKIKAMIQDYKGNLGTVGLALKKAASK